MPKEKTEEVQQRNIFNANDLNWDLNTVLSGEILKITLIPFIYVCVCVFKTPTQILLLKKTFLKRMNHHINMDLVSPRTLDRAIRTSKAV